METRKLAGLEPASVFGYFEELCSMPHGSGNTRIISNYLVDFAKKNGLRYIQDDTDNVIIFSDATPGYEDHEPVILQGHMDMVCDQDTNCTIDMAADGLDVTHNERFVYANGTTLGADNGIAVAMGMAILTDKTIPHPPIELIVTTDEEIGLLGAAAIDLSEVKGRKMINLDSEGEGIFTVSCAGGGVLTMTLGVERRAVYGPCIRLSVEGLKGGHSGAEIHCNRGNANKIMGEFMSRIQKIMPLCLTSLQGGAKDNAIAHTCSATLVAMGTYLERINAIAEELQAEVRATYDEPNALVQAFDVDALGGNALTTESTARIIELLCAAPNAVQTWSKDIEGLVQTSLNLGVIKLGETFQATFSVRSSVGAEKEEVMEQLAKLADMFGASWVRSGDYPAWEYVKESTLRDTMVKVYTDCFGKAPQVIALHAGLECGLFSDKLPGLDAVSIGPQMYDIHTTRERLDIASTERTWKFVLEVLKNL